MQYYWEWPKTNSEAAVLNVPCCGHESIPGDAFVNNGYNRIDAEHASMVFGWFESIRGPRSFGRPNSGRETTVPFARALLGDQAESEAP
jgi:hypothetical protein